MFRKLMLAVVLCAPLTAFAGGFASFLQGASEGYNQHVEQEAQESKLSPDYLRAQCNNMGITSGEPLQNCMLKMYEINKSDQPQKMECHESSGAGFTCESR